MATELEDILKDDPVEAPKAEPPVEAKDDPGEKPAEEPVEETLEEEPPVEEPAPAEPPPAKEESHIPIAALLDEREKRQALQKQIDDLKAKEEEEKPDFFEDPEGRLKALETSLEAKANDRFVNLTVDLARKNHEDFDEVMSGWKEVVEANPGVLDSVMASENPGEESYRIAKQYKDMQEIGDPSEYREKLKAEILAELKKEQQKGVNLPESLVDERNVGSRKGPEFSGPTPLDQVLKP